MSSIPELISAQKSILFIGREATQDGFAMDRDCFDSIASWGYEVTYIANAAFESGTVDIYTGHDGVFMSETVNSSSMNNFGKRDNYPLPIVNTEGYTPRVERWDWLTNNDDDFHQNPDATGSDDERMIIIKDNSHYITSIFDKNEEVTWSNATGDDLKEVTAVSFKEVNMEYSGLLAKNKIIDSEADFWTMVTIDESAAMPNRHFLWGVVGDGINGVDPHDKHYGTPEFFTIIKRALEWALDIMPEPENVNNQRQDDLSLVAFPNPASERATIRFNAPASGNAIITLHNITGQQLMVLSDKNVNPGNNFVFLDATEYSSGIYLVRVNMGDYTQYTKLIID